MSKYWEKRALKFSDEDYVRSKEVVRDIKREFDRAFFGIEKDISYYLERIAYDNGLSYQEARKKLKQGEFEAFRMSLKDYIKKGEGVLSDDVIKEFQNASNLHNISRLQAMGLEMKKHLDYLYNKYYDKTENLLATTYEEDFYKAMYELQKVTGYKKLQALDSDVLDMVIKKPWTADGKTFSNRIWTHQDELLHNLQSSLMQKCIMGTDTKTLIDDLKKKMDTSFYKAKRLIETELGYFSNKAYSDSFKKGNLKKYEILATLDSKTSEICREMDGKVFYFKDMQQGINAPPFHCHCRSVIMPCFDDEIEKGLDDKSGRVARDKKTGKSIDVGNVNYRQWYNKYVVGNGDFGYNVNTDLGKFGKVVDNPNITVDWNIKGFHSQYKMHERNISKSDVEEWVKNGVSIEQIKNNKYAFVTKEGVAIVRIDGKLITAWSSRDYDDNMEEIIKKLFGDDKIEN